MGRKYRTLAVWALTMYMLISFLSPAANAANYTADWNAWGYSPGNMTGQATFGGESISLAITGATDTIASLDLGVLGASDTPLVSPFYSALSQDNLATSVQLSEFVVSSQNGDGSWNHQSKQLVFTFDFGEPSIGVSGLAFSLLDVDGHEIPRFNRQEIYTITGYLGKQPVNPQISSRAIESGVHAINNNQIKGLKIVRPNTLPLPGEGTLLPINGVADILFSQAVDRVEIIFEVNVDSSVTVADSKPGFGIGGFSFATRERMDISAIKRWDDVSMYQEGMPPPPTIKPDVWLKLTRQSSNEPLADVPDSLIKITASDYDEAGDALFTWADLPLNDPFEKPYIYKVVETSEAGTGSATPANYMVRVQKDANDPNRTILTNIYLPIQNGNLSTLPCQLNWFADATIDSSIQDYSNQYFMHKVSCTLFGEESGYFAMHHWGGSKVGESVFWRIPLATNHDIVNGRLVIPFDDPDFSPFVPATNAVHFYTEQWRFDLITFHTTTPDPINSYTLLTDPNSPITNPAPTTRPNYTFNYDETGTRIVSLTMDIPFMPAKSAYMIQFSGVIVNAATPDNPNVNYYQGATFTADYNCVIADKVWLGEPPADATQAEFTLYANDTEMPGSTKNPTEITLDDDTKVLRAVWSQLPFYDEDGKPINYTVKETALAEGYILANTDWLMEPVAQGAQQHIKHYTFTNMPLRDITGIKKWESDTQEQRTTIYLMVAERVKDAQGLPRLVVPTKADGAPLYGAIAVDLTQAEFTHTFTGLPTVRLDGTPIEYTVVEARNNMGTKVGAYYDFNFGVPTGYLRSTEVVDGEVVITNTRLPDYEPVKDGDNSLPCEINWYTQNVRDRFSNVEPTRYKVSSTYFADSTEHSTPSGGVMVLQAWPEDNWRSMWWRFIMGIDNEVHEGTITVDLSELRALGMVPVKDANGFYARFAPAAGNQTWLNRGGGLDAAYNQRYTVREKGDITESLSADGNTLTLYIPKMDSYSALMFNIFTSLDPALTPAQDYYMNPLDAQSLDGTRYAMGITFQAQTRCVHVEKTWLGITDGTEEAEVELTLNGTSLLEAGRTELEKHLGATFTSTSTDTAPTAYRAFRDWINAVDKVVPGFFYTMAQNPGTPMKEQLWVDWSVNPPVFKDYNYTFDQTQMDLVLQTLATYYQATLTPDNNQHTFGQLPWQTPEAYSVVETRVPDGWVQQGEVTRDMNEWRVLLGITNRKYADLIATKTWVNGPAADHTSVQLILTRQIVGGTSETVTEPVYTVTGAAPTFTYTWPELPQTDDSGNAYTYAVAEAGVVDGKVSVNGNTYEVTQAGNAITNTYKKPPVPTDPPTPTYPTLHVPLSARKVLHNGKLSAGQFTFLLKDRSGKVIAEAVNGTDGSIVFPDRAFSKVVENYMYTIEERVESDSTMTYDSTVYTVKITTRAINNKLEATVNILKDEAPYAGDIVFTNQKKLPETGDSAKRNIILIVTLASCLAVLSFAIQKRKNV